MERRAIPASHHQRGEGEGGVRAGHQAGAHGTPTPPPATFLFVGPVADGSKNRLKIIHGGTIASMVDLGGSLAVASMGLFATGVSTDMNSKRRLSHLPTDGEACSGVCT